MVRWLPLESNPEVMNKLLSAMGVPASAAVTDVYGLEPELLAMVPKPVYALLLLYPLTDKSEGHAKKQEEELANQEVSSEVYYMKQFVGNACGTVALMHAVANNTKRITLSDGVLKTFLEKTKDMDPEARGHALETDDTMTQVHEECATEGQTSAPDREQKLDTHFIAIVNVDGKIYELDGRKKAPVNHGDTTEDTFLQDGAAVLKGFMDRDSSETRFAVVALTGPE